MATDGKIRDEKLQYNSNKEATKILPLSSGKVYLFSFRKSFGKTNIGKRSCSPVSKPF